MATTRAAWYAARPIRAPPNGLPGPARPEATTTATGRVPQHPQARVQENARPSGAFSPSAVRRRPNCRSTTTSRRQQNQDRRAASATTNAPTASSRQFHDSPKTGHSATADVPQTCPLRHAVFGVMPTSALHHRHDRRSAPRARRRRAATGHSWSRLLPGLIEYSGRSQRPPQARTMHTSCYCTGLRTSAHRTSDIDTCIRRYVRRRSRRAAARRSDRRC
jgi:hypothetical protein